MEILPGVFVIVIYWGKKEPNLNNFVKLDIGSHMITIINNSSVLYCLEYYLFNYCK